MGGLESRFNTLLLEGKEEEALDMWHRNAELQSSYRLNVAVKGSHHRDSPLSLVTRAGMKLLVHEFLERGADPLVRNSNGDTALHIACVSARCSSRTNQLRSAILQLLLDKVVATCGIDSYDDDSTSTSPLSHTTSVEKGITISERLSRSMGNVHRLFTNGLNPPREQFDLGVQNKARNTPLHLAAASGLLGCVELLLAHGAPLFVQNVAGQTPCDVAGETKQLIIAKLLESKMVFTTGHPQEQSEPSKPISRLRNKSFHNAHTLNKLKLEIVESVATRLQVAEFPAEALLMAYGWSEDLVVQAWEQDKCAACKKAGLDPDDTLVSGGYVGGSPMASLCMHQCGICYEDIPPIGTIRVPCGHYFCKECWKQYLECQIKEGAGREIRCPGHECQKLIPSDVVQVLVPEKVFEKYSTFNLHQFVDSSYDIKWCPFPDCGLAVSFSLRHGGSGAEGSEGTRRGRGGAETTGGPKQERGGAECPDQSGTRGVNIECEKGHGFCWYCMSEPHEPCDCHLWKRWKEVICKMREMEGDHSNVGREAVSNARWIVRFTKPCPHCSAPIQKSEGCNHITCKKCHYDFCWVCLDPWSLHNHRTGGYFTCNRYKAQQKADHLVSKARQNMEEEYRRQAERELKEKKAEFEHYHSRYSNHLDSLELELGQLQASKDKAEELAKMGQVLERKVAAVRARSLMDTMDENGTPPGSPSTSPSLMVAMAEGNFLEDIIRVLLNARRILSASYCIGYFIPHDKREERQAHETLQGKLEEAVEMLSQMVNRSYLRTPQSQMSAAARNVDYLCDEYLSEMQEVAKVASIAQRVAKDSQPKKRTSTSPHHLPPPLTRPVRGPYLDVMGRPLSSQPPRRAPDGIVDSMEFYIFSTRR